MSISEQWPKNLRDNKGRWIEPSRTTLPSSMCLRINARLDAMEAKRGGRISMPFPEPVSNAGVRVNELWGEYVAEELFELRPY
jgi:hypothetical protein